MSNDTNDWNAQVIREFRENGGRVGGMFEGASLLILHTTGARSGAERLNPLMYQDLGHSWAVFASKGGATTNPDWFHNVKANPTAAVEVGTETVPVRARIAEGEEHERIWTRQKQDRPQFAEYEQTAGGRRIPVVILERA